MLKNFIKIAYRNILKQKGYSFINITGLALGLACTMILLLYLKSETNYDLFHKNVDRIIRINSLGNVAGREFNVVSSPLPLFRALKNDHTEFEATVRLNSIFEQGFYYNDELHLVKNWFYAEDAIFDIFTFDKVKGQLRLKGPNDVVIAESIANSFFGNKDPIGLTFSLDNDQKTLMTVVGVFKDFPEESHMHPKWIASYQSYWRYSQDNVWLGFNTNTYALIRPNTDIEKINELLPKVLEKYAGNDLERFGAKATLSAQYLKDIHLYSSHLSGHIEQPGSISNIYIMGIIAIFIIIIASINFMNLSTARSSKRAKEVGMRKVLGAQPINLILQFLGESIFISLISLLLAFSLVELCLPIFNSLANKGIQFSFIADFNMVLVFIGLTIIVGFLSGLYPSFYLSSFTPIHTLKGEMNRSNSALLIRRSLVIIQFTVSIALIIGTILIIDQIDFMQNKNLGFNKDQVVAIELPSENAMSKYEVIKLQLESLTDVKHVSSASDYPGDGSNNNSVYRAENQTEAESSLLDQARINYGFFETLEIELVKGRFFSKNFPTDADESVILNESAVAKFGYEIENSVGKKIYRFKSANEQSLVTIIGVVKDFHSKSLREKISPVVYNLDNRAPTILVSLNTQNLNKTIGQIESVFSEINPNETFNYEFINAKFSKFYKEERRFSTIINTFTFLAIFIACLGLFGLASFMADQKVKEIGIRKVLGASIFDIIKIFSNEFGKLILVSILLSVPLSFYVISEWLKNFAYHIEITSVPFLLAGIISIVITMITIGYQAYNAANNDPIIALKYE